MALTAWLTLALDVVLAILLIWLASRTLSSPGLMESVILFVGFGLTLTMVWVRLGIPDVALAEAAIGAGLTGSLLLSALARLPDATHARTPAHRDPSQPDMPDAPEPAPAATNEKATHD